MPQFSDNDINEAKRRVWEMRNRATRIFDDNNEQPKQRSNRNDEEAKEDTAPENNDENDFKDKNDKSFLIILSLILILSQEGADNTLIFALLYLLL